MRKTIVFLFLISTISVYSQNTLDIIRASNYYAKAVDNYRLESYSTALSKLKASENNLKGKTNRDLEYLKIMTNYKLKHYKTAYDLLVKYFDGDYKNKTAYYRNVKLYREKYNIDYDADLTKIFVELEAKYKVVTSLNAEDVIDHIVEKIKTLRAQTGSLKHFIKNNTITHNISFELHKKEEIITNYTRYKKYKNWKSTYTYFTKLQAENEYSRPDNSGCTILGIFRLNGRNNNAFSVHVTYADDSYLKKNSYVLKYVVEGQQLQYAFFGNWGELDYIDWSWFDYYNTRDKIIKDWKDKVLKTDFYKEKSFTRNLQFSPNEITILENSENYRKLRDRLLKEGFL